MPQFEYKGYKFEAPENMSEDAWKQTTSYFDSLPPISSPSLVDQIPGDVIPPTPEPETSITDKALGVLETPLNVITGGTSGMVSGAMNMVANPLIEAAKGNINSYDDFSKQLEAGFHTGMEAGTYHPRTQTGKGIAENITAPVIQELMPLIGLHGSIPKTPKLKEITTQIKSFKEPTPNIVKESITDLAPEFKAESGISPGEYKILEGTRKIVTDKIDAITEDILKIEETVGKTGEATPEIIKELTTLEEALNRAADDLNKIDSDLSGDITTRIEGEKAVQQDVRKQELIKRVTELREQEKAKWLPETDTIKETPPIEIALEKIAEAQRDTPEQLNVRIEEATKKLEAIIDREKQSALWEALNREIDAYEAIREGKEPDLSWANKEEPLPKIETPVEEIIFKPLEETFVDNFHKDVILDKKFPTGEEIANLLRGKKTIGEVFDIIKEKGLGTKGQRQLLSILNRIPHVRSAGFRFGQAIERDGKFSRGQYLSWEHIVELHKDGNLKTILHESIHAATHTLLTDGTSIAAKRIIKLYEDFKKRHPDLENYGMTDVHEFVAEVFTNSGFQKLLTSIIIIYEGKPASKMYTVFKDIVKEGIEKLTGKRIEKSVFDAAIDLSSDLLETAKRKDETFFQKLVDKQKKIARPEMSDVPTKKTLRGMIGRNMFGMNTMEGFYRKYPRVQRAFHDVRKATEEVDKITNELWHGTANVLSKGKVGFFERFSKVKDADSPIVAVEKTSNVDMAGIHDVFKKGFEEGLDYAENLEKNGQHLNDKQVKVYNTLAGLFKGLYDVTVKAQEALGKKHILPFRKGWYPASRMGNWSVNITYRGNIVHTETFKTQHAADVFRRRVSDGSNLKFLDISEVLDKSKDEGFQPNTEMASIIKDHLNQKFPAGGANIEIIINDLLYSMQTRGGKLGYHHQHRTNVPGYKGTELFRTPEELGGSFKEGIQGEVNNFSMNLKALKIKHKVNPNLEYLDPVERSAIEQIYDSALGRNKELLGIKDAEQTAVNFADKFVDVISKKILGKDFEARDHSALGHLNKTALGLFYTTKMVAKPVFVLAQLLTTPMIIPEMARSGHGLRAFYSFGKASTKLLTGDKALWKHLDEVSQEYNTIQPQFRESLNLERHMGTESRAKKALNFVQDYILLGEVGQKADAMSRLVSYASAFTHYTDLGMPKEQASYYARLATDKAMNVYDTQHAAPMFDKMGAIGQQMKPLNSFALNQIGNFASYVKELKRGNAAPLVAYGLIATAMGGMIGLPFVQEYERFRKIAMEYFDLEMPSILEIFAGDESFLDRLFVTPEDRKNLVTYGIPAMSGIDLSSSIRSNETMLGLFGAIVLGQEDAASLMPILSATAGTVGQLPALAKALSGEGSVGAGSKAVNAMITGPIGYGIKEGLGLNTTKFMGEDTGNMATGIAGNAESVRTPTDIFAGLLGTRSIAQKRRTQELYEILTKDKMKQNKVRNISNLYVESGNPKYIKQLIDLGIDDAKKLENIIDTGAYNKFVDAHTRYYRTKEGRIDPKKATAIFNFGNN